MKKRMLCIMAVILTGVICLSGCRKAPTMYDNLWENAMYTEDTVLGEGKKTTIIEVKAGDKAVTFTIRSDAETVGDALKTHHLISGEEGAYGMYVKKVNGITADFDKDGYYWSFLKNGELMMTGVDSTTFSDGERFSLERMKG